MPSIDFNPGKSLQVWAALGLLLLGVVVRWPHLHQSLWYDEMTTTVEYVSQPWQKVLAGRAGEYVPNNHVLHTVLVKLAYTLGAGGQVSPPVEMLLRLPAMLAGTLVPIALAWPLRRTHPLIAMLLALVTTLHPWLLAFSVESRGYSLLLLLGILATNCLPLKNQNWTGIYAILMALAIYTVPLAVLLFPGHAIAMLVTRRHHFLRWLGGCCLGIVLASILYWPMVNGLLAYYRHPYMASMNYRTFLNGLPRFALAGSWVSGSAIYWALPAVTIIFGSVLGWSRVALRPLLITLGTTTLLGVLMPLVVSGTTEPRFVAWSLLWYCLSATAVLSVATSRWGRVVGATGFAALIAWQLMTDIDQLPNQQIREGMALVDKITPPGRDVMVLYLGAGEATILYSGTHHAFLPAPDSSYIADVQNKAIAETGHLPWVVIFYEQLASDRNFFPPESAGLWSGLIKHYHLAAPRLPGRIAPVAVYAPNQDE